MTASKLQKRLLEDVVIFENKESERTGAQSLAPDHSPRQATSGASLPPRGVLTESSQGASLQQRVEQFLFHQSELLDEKHWGAYIDLFADDGVYWMPVTPDQTEWLDSPSIFAEDKRMMEIRRGRVTHPNAWSQAPQWGTSHVIGNVVIESVSETEIAVRSRFQMLELRRDALRHFGGTYRHKLRRDADDFKIVLQRVDLLNGQAPFDYVLQIWV
jgi:3-phenylpropionate/cinnamic acid dioxygenase small subunit